MTSTDQDPSEISRKDAVLIRRVAELSSVPEPTAQRRVAFQAELDRRLEKRRRRFARPIWIGAVAVGVAAIALLWLATGRPSGSTDPAPDLAASSARASAAREAPAATSADALLSLMDEDLDDVDSELPADYAAINSLILGS